MKSRFGILALTAFVLVLVLAAPALLSEEGSGGGKDAFLAAKCNTCHSVSTAGIEAKTTSEKLKGPDLVGVANDFDAEGLAAFLRQESEKDGKKHKKAWKGTDEDLSAIVDWLLEQKG